MYQVTDADRPSGRLREPRLRRGASTMLWIAVALLILAAASLSVAVVSTRSGILQADQMFHLRLGTELLLTELKDVETGQRGFLVTGNPIFLDPYHDARPRIAAMLADVIMQAKQLAPDASVNALTELVRRKLELTERAIRIVQAGHLDEARGQVEEGEGKTVMDAIRVVVAQISNVVDRRRDAIESHTNGRATLASVIALASAVLACGLVGIMAMLLNRRGAARLRLAEEGRALALDAAALGTWEWNSRSDGVNACPITRRLFGLSMTASLALPDLLSAIIAEDRSGAEAALRGATASDACHWEGRVAIQEGEVRRVYLSAGLYRDDGGQPTVLRGVAQDVTARRQAEQRTRELELELWHSSRVSTVEEIASTTAHEIAQPVSAARTYFQACDNMIRSGRVYDRDKLLAGMASGMDGLTKASSIIQNLHRFLRKEAGQCQRMTLNTAVQEAVALGAVGFERDGHGRIVYGLAPALPHIVANRTQIQQVVVNLVRNAVEAMAPCPVRELTVKTIHHDARIRVSIGDTGPGLAAEIASSPFLAFKTTKDNGLGLGLSISQSIVRAHNGTMAVETGPTGTTFFVDLPVEIPHAAVDAA